MRLREFFVSSLPSPTVATPIRVPAGTTAQEALKEAGVPLKGPDGLTSGPGVYLPQKS